MDSGQQSPKTMPDPWALVGDPDVEAPICVGCGETPPVGTALDQGLPRGWFSRQIDGITGITEYACSKACVPE